MKHNAESVYELSESQLEQLEQVIRNMGGRPKDICFHICSGDDVYAVFELKTVTPCTQNRFLYVKGLYAGDDDSSHYISEYGFFANQFIATQYACKQAEQEEKGYGA